MDPDTFTFAPDVSKKVAAAREAVAACGGIVGASEMAKRWGLSKQRVEQLRRLDGFPGPLAGEGIPRWLRAEVDAWNKARQS